MSLSNLFYPGNPERREKLIRRSQELRDLMFNNFRATNQLISVLKEHLGLSFCSIILNEKATVKENCDVIVERIHEIQAAVEKIDQELKDKLEPTLYDKLKYMNLSIPEHTQVSAVLHCILGVAYVTSTAVVSWLVKSGTILKNIRISFRFLSKTKIACLGVSVLFLGIEAIVEAILGAVERKQLENALKEYEMALEEFKPASEKYQDSITYVRIKLEIAKCKE